MDLNKHPSPIRPLSCRACFSLQTRAPRQGIQYQCRWLVCLHTGPVKSVQWPTCPSPVHPQKWTKFLLAHPDQKFAKYIGKVFEEGFHIGFRETGLVLTKALRNYPSVLENSKVVNDYITTEVSTGRFMGPLARPLCSLVHTNPIGLVPKSHQAGQWRMIVES